jgi:aspartate racemase
VTKHIGIVAVSPEGAALFYRQIFRQASHLVGDPAQHPRVTLHNEPLASYLAALNANQWEAIAAQMARSARYLAGCGAQFCLCPDNVVQHAIHIAQSASPIPWLAMPELVAEAVAADGRKTVALLGTKWVTMASTYQTHLGLKGTKVVVPSVEDAQSLDDIILRELVYGEVNASSSAKVLEIVAHLADKGAEAVIIASSEIPLIVNPVNCRLPIYDSAEVLARGAVLQALKPD